MAAEFDEEFSQYAFAFRGSGGDGCVDPFCFFFGVSAPRWHEFYARLEGGFYTVFEVFVEKVVVEVGSGVKAEL